MEHSLSDIIIFIFSVICINHKLQIILVDDASERKYLQQELEDAIGKLDKVQLLRSKQRSGLVGARLMGAKVAQGDVLVFLDAHCEVRYLLYLNPLSILCKAAALRKASRTYDTISSTRPSFWVIVFTYLLSVVCYS